MPSISNMKECVRKQRAEVSVETRSRSRSSRGGTEQICSRKSCWPQFFALPSSLRGGTEFRFVGAATAKARSRHVVRQRRITMLSSPRHRCVLQPQRSSCWDSRYRHVLSRAALPRRCGPPFEIDSHLPPPCTQQMRRSCEASEPAGFQWRQAWPQKGFASTHVISSRISCPTRDEIVPLLDRVLLMISAILKTLIKPGDNSSFSAVTRQQCRARVRNAAVQTGVRTHLH